MEVSVTSCLEKIQELFNGLFQMKHPQLHANHITLRLDEIQEFLNGFGINNSQLHAKHTIKSAVTVVKFLKATLSYAKRSDVDEGMPSAILKSLEDIVLALAYFESHGFQFWYYEFVLNFRKRDRKLWSLVGKFSKKLLELEVFDEFPDGFVFDEFAASVQEFLLSFREMGYEMSKKDGQGLVGRLCTEAQGNCIATSQKLDSFRCFVGSFSKHCTDQIKLQSLLDRAGAVVASIFLETYPFHDISEYSYNYAMAEHCVRASSGMSRALSPHNPDVIEVYREALQTYAEILKASKDMVMEEEESLFILLQSAQNRVHILGDILDFPLMDLVVELEDQNEDVEILLEQGYAAVAMEAGSLCSSVSNAPLLSKLLNKLNLIKAEIFVLELHNHKSNLSYFGENRAAAIRVAIRFLSEFFKTPEAYMEDTEKLMLSLIEAFLREAGSLSEQLSEDMILESSLAIFKLFKVSAKLMVLIYNIPVFKFLAEFRIQTLRKSLIILRALLSSPLNDNLKDENASTVCETLASQAASFVCSFGNRDREMNMPIEINHFPFQAAGTIELCIEEIMAFDQQGPWSMFPDFPKNDGVVFAKHLLGKMSKLLTNKPDTIAFMQDQVEALLVEMEFLRSFLEDVEKEDSKNKDLGLRVIRQIYEVEHIIDMFILGDVPVWYHQLVLLIAIEETKLIKAQIQEYCNHIEEFELLVQNVQLSSAHMTPEGSNLRTEEGIVGFDDQAKNIAQKLQSGSKALQIVSVVGMAGIGKTTLAKKVYRSPSIEHHFTVRAQCYVSQVYKKRELLLDILGDIAEVTDGIRKMDDNELAQTVYQRLKRQRYLILMDDMWRIETWNDLRNIFPDDNMRSRILFTTRERDVALKANSKKPHVVPFLNEERSWDLLKTKVFEGRGCPSELSEVGRRIAKNCRGLPLAIVVVAGILKRAELKKDRWEDIAEHLRSRIADGQFMDILEFSYSHLPSYLKPCYLYLGIFLEDQEIPARKLQRLWIAEGFIPKIDSKNLEETAERFLVELINRSLVMESKRSSLGGSKTCRIHDMLRDLCLKKAKEENFMQLVSMNYKSNSEILVGLQYRLCVHFPQENIVQLRPFGSQVHSLLFFATNKPAYTEPCDISFISENFKLLRVLEMESFFAASMFPRGIDFMLGLNYLAIKGNIKSVPSSISKLWNLESLIVKGRRGEVTLPSTLWSMATLRHVEVRPRASLSLSGPELENSLALENLTTFSCPAFSHGKGTKNILKRMIKLRKLKCICFEHWTSTLKCDVFPGMEILTQLESLNIYYIGKSFPWEFSFPPSLKKLTLSKFRLPWEYILVFSRRLHNLEVLKLLFRAFEGDNWDMSHMTEGYFPKLKFLKLENLNLAKWNASGDHFPELERLVLRSCKKLEGLPCSFGEVSTLQMIEVHWCSHSAAKSVETIFEQQLDFGNKDFEVRITPPQWNFRTSS